MEDTEIIDLFLERNDNAIQMTSEKYGRRLRNLSFGIVADRETAEECENDTYMRTWNSIPPTEPREHFFAYLACIIRNVSLDCCRKQASLKRSAYIAELSQEMEECLPAPNDVESQIDELTVKSAINGFLNTQSEEKRNIFLRRYWFMDPVNKIATRFDISESKVKTVLHRMRNQLREYLEQEGYYL